MPPQHSTSSARPSALRAGEHPAATSRGRWLFAGLILPAIALAAFGSWGAFTTAGIDRFDEEMGVLPLLAKGVAPLLVVFGFLGLQSSVPSTTRPHSDEAKLARPL